MARARRPEIAVKGIEEVLRELQRKGDAYKKAVEAAAYGQGIALDELINRKGWVPVHTGRLRASHYVTKPVMAGNSPTVEAGYAAPYADEKHEEQRNHRSGVPRWMKRAVEIFARGYAPRMRDSIMDNLARDTTIEHLAGVVPTEPHDPGGNVTAYQAKYGYTKEQRKALRGAKRDKRVRLVQRWKLPKRKGGKSHKPRGGRG